jgi:ABC-type lipoprotein export system ATPase subunit
MKIRTISVYGLFGRHDHCVNVFGDGVTYIHSPNGCGKSTLIRMVSLLFAGNMKELMAIPFERMDVSFSDGADVIVERSDDGPLIQMQRNEIGTELTADELPALMRTMFIPPERTFIRRGDGHIVSAVEHYAHDLSVKLKNARKRQKLTVPPYNDDKGDDELVSWAKDLNAKLSFIRDAGFMIDMPAGLRFPPTRYDLIEERKECLDLIHSVHCFVEKNHYLSESVVVFKDIMNDFLFDKDMTVDKNNNIVFLLENGVTLPLSGLSSGEKQIFIIFYRMLFEAPPSSFVMIDEPEISLHVSWQQKVGRAMKDIARLRGLQIVAATHSPQIVHDDWDLANELRAGRA